MEILYNSKIKDYTLKPEIDGTKSEKRVPLRFKLDDKTKKYRKIILKEKILNLK